STERDRRSGASFWPVSAGKIGRLRACGHAAAHRFERRVTFSLSAGKASLGTMPRPRHSALLADPRRNRPARRVKPGSILTRSAVPIGGPLKIMEARTTVVGAPWRELVLLELSTD